MIITIADAIDALPPEQQTKWARLQRGVRDPFDTISEWTPEIRRAVTHAWADLARSRSDAREVLLTITAWSSQLGVLLTCRVAREALIFVPEDEKRPLQAIETAERWLLGEATVEECKLAAKKAFDAADFDDSTNRAAFYAAFAASHAAEAGASVIAALVTPAATDAIADAAAYAAAARAAATADEDAWKDVHSKELHRLCGVIAEDLFSGHTAQWIYSSGTLASRALGTVVGGSTKRPRSRRKGRK